MTHRYTALLAVMLPNFVYGFFRFSTGFLLPGLEDVYSIGDAVAGAIVSVSVGMVGIGVFLSGYSSRRYGERLTIMAGFLTFAVSMGGVVASANIYEFTSLFLLASFGSGLMIPASYGLIGRTLQQRRGIAVGIITSGYNIGGLVGPPLVTFVLVTYGWSASFISFSSVGLIGLVLFAVMLGRKGEDRSEASKVSTRSLLRNRSIVILMVANFIADLAFLSYVSWTPSYMTDRFKLQGSSSEVIGAFFGAGVGLGGLGAVAAGTLFDRIGGRRTTLLGGVTCALSALGIYVTGSFLTSTVLVVMTGFLSNWFWTLLTAMAQASTSQENRADAISLVQTAGFVGAFVGPGLAGLIGGAASLPLILTVVLPYLAYSVLVAGAYRDH